jgi:hypothetical protein
MTAVGSLRAVACLLLALSGCGGDSKPGPEACAGEGCSASCRALSKGGDCDVRREACQERIFAAVSCVRGAEGEAPPIRLRSEDEERADDAEDAGADGGEPDAMAMDVASPDAGPSRLTSRERWDLGLGLLGLKAPDPAFDTVDNLGGYYDGSEQQITLIDRGRPLDSPGMQFTLAHEFVHALQDQQVGLFELYRATGETTDVRAALGCLIEGEATLYQELAWGVLRDLPVDAAYLRRTFSDRLKYARDEAAAAQSPYDDLWLMRYGLGASYLLERWLEGGNAAVQALFDAPPLTTVFWMRGVSQPDAPWRPRTRSLACDWAAAPEGFEREHHDSLGAFALYAFLSRTLQADGIHPNARSWDLALGWEQDRLEIFAGPNDETAVSWRIRLSSAEDAALVGSQLAEALGGARVAVVDAELEILASDSDETQESWQGSSADGCGAAPD